ncbi:E3 SUMO-protein ligase NSE2 isoform X1 [Nothoprocta perdicaria]|uniref:E3 SUMO-protein ligase NSE2 isoform X1 n=1 Tax=Nothoprocta perdicaria TaxID=30464 RepID=UPI000E1C0D90|nr:E3 SUMO-protein ligase NSE2 isoform X1 [Nothoprocta perdicaria]
MPGAATISFSCVDSSLSSLRNCQSYIDTGMDIATRVALDLVESFIRLQSGDGNESIEQIDEDIAVTQSQVNFICPITQMEMKKPVRNKVCGHVYEEDAILKIIQTRNQQKKKVCCPKIGCSHTDVKKSHLVPDEALKRAIDSQRRQR